MEMLGGLGPGAFAVAAGVILLAAVVQSSAGIGFGLVAAPLLYYVNPLFLPGTVIFLGTLVSLLSSMRDFRHVNAGFVAAGLAGRIPAALAAASLVAMVSAAAFEALFAVSILVAVALSWRGPSFRPTGPRMALAGVLSGFMGTLTAVGAPPFALALQNAAPGQLRATLNAVLLLGALVSLGALAAFGQFGLADMVRGAALVPAAFAGFWLARFVIRDPRSAGLLRPVVLGLCVAASVILLVRAGLRLLA